MRHPRNLSYRADPLPDMHAAIPNLAAWLEQLASQKKLGPQVWLLAHAVDGVIWGRIDESGKLHLSSDLRPTTSPALTLFTLLEARLFGTDAQIHIWRNQSATSEVAFSSVYVQDAAGDADSDDNGDTFDEYHRLWGVQADGWQNGFTLLRNGQEGLCHAVPIDVPAYAFDSKGGRQPVTLCVRHYVCYRGETGEAYIACSRLVSVSYKSDKE